MTRTMRDSTTATDIPREGLNLVAGYSNGRFAWTPDDWARFPKIPHVHIDVNGSHPSDSGVLDVETGDATPAGAVPWVAARHAVGDPRPVIYCNRSVRPEVVSAMNRHGFTLARHYVLWIATLDGTRTLPDMTGVIAVQFAGEKQTGGHFDESVVYDDTWHAPAHPPPNHVPTRHQAQEAARVIGAYIHGHK